MAKATIVLWFLVKKYLPPGFTSHNCVSDKDWKPAPSKMLLVFSGKAKLAKVMLCEDAGAR